MQLCTMLRPVTSVSMAAPTLPTISGLHHGSAPLLRARTSSTMSACMPSLAHRKVARELVAEAEARLLPSAVPADVVEFQNSTGTAVGMLDVRRGVPASLIDFMLYSSLHCKVPNGAIDITSVLISLNALSDAPHFLMEFIHGSPSSMVVILNLLPRKDLALHPEYIVKYYENTGLDKQRENIEELPQSRPYRSPSLFVRSACSPTALSVTIDCGHGGETTLKEIVSSHLASAVKEVLQIWLHSCAGQTSEMENAEREIMVRRDQAVRLKSIEVDLTANLPKMFGPDVSGQVIAKIRTAFGA